MGWTKNQPGDSSWVNNATTSEMGATAFKVGSSDVKGFRLNDNKCFYFGKDSDICMQFVSDLDMWKVSHHNPSNGAITTILSWEEGEGLTIDSPTITGTFTMGGLDLSQSASDSNGVPSETAVEGKIVYTEKTGSTVGALYVGLDTGS